MRIKNVSSAGTVPRIIINRHPLKLTSDSTALLDIPTQSSQPRTDSSQASCPE